MISSSVVLLGVAVVNAALPHAGNHEDRRGSGRTVPEMAS
jgi:hypothetical protein